MRIHSRPAVFLVFALLTAFSPNGLFAGVGEWTSNGPDGGIVLSIAAAPSEPTTVYLATDRRVYKSVDTGAHWAPTGLTVYFSFPADFQSLLTTSTPSVVYAIFAHGLRRTTDGGETWVEDAGIPGRIVAATVDRDDPLVLYAATQTRLYRTNNGGDSWQPLANLPAGASLFTGLAVSPDDSAVLYAGVILSIGYGVYRSDDRGANWTPTGLREATGTLLFDPRDDSRLYALSGSGLQVTTNRGESWRRLASAAQYATRLAIDPADSSRLYLVDRGVVFSSSDGGETVTRVSDRSLGDSVGAIAVSGSSVVLAGSWRGLYRSQDAGRVWSPSDLGIREISVSSLAIDPTNPATVFAASSQGIYESHDGGSSWDEPPPGSPDTSLVAIDPTDRSTLYAAGRELLKSTDGGRTWEKRSPREMAYFIAALLIDPSNPRRLFASSESVFRSQDGAQSWQVVMRPEDDVSSYYYPASARALAIAPSDSSTVYAGGYTNDYAAGFVSRSEDGGTTWSLPATLYGRVTALAVDSCDPRIVYAGTDSGVYRSADGGATWSEPGLAGNFVSLVSDPRHSSTLFAGTTDGLFWTNDSGVTWTRFEPFLPMPILSLAIDSSGRYLHAATSKGVFDLERTFDACRSGPDRLCLIGAKYQVSVTARDPRTGASIAGRGIVEGDRFGYFSFPDLTGDPEFPEVLVKMVNASGQPPPYGGYDWVFHSSLTNFAYTLKVLETETGRTRTYYGAISTSLTCGEADTSAFERSCLTEESSGTAQGRRLAAPSGTELSLLGGRFRATLQARDPRTGRTADGAALARADGFGYFSLPGFTGDPSFPEVFVKMIDGRTQPGRSFWVFHTGLTDLAYTLTVTDTATGAVRIYPGGAVAGTYLCGSADTTAFRDP